MRILPVRTLTRWLGTVATLVVIGLSAVACSPAPRYNVALFLRDGDPVALLHPCPGEAVTELAVTDLSTESAPRPGGPTTDLYVPYWNVLAVNTNSRPTEIRLLTVPLDWTLNRENPFPLLEFQRDHRYRVGTRQIGSRDVEFTLTDLESLDKNQVWALSSKGEETGMTRDEFFHMAESHCD